MDKYYDEIKVFNYLTGLLTALLCLLAYWKIKVLRMTILMIFKPKIIVDEWIYGDEGIFDYVTNWFVVIIGYVLIIVALCGFLCIVYLISHWIMIKLFDLFKIFETLDDEHNAIILDKWSEKQYRTTIVGKVPVRSTVIRHYVKLKIGDENEIMETIEISENEFNKISKNTQIRVKLNGYKNKRTNEVVTYLVEI